MVRHSRPSARICSTRENLVSFLRGELKNSSRIEQPVILEDHTPETDTVRVHVIWDRWEECPREQRTDIILDAYLSLGAEWRSKITLALGITPAEAVSLGLLPFQVVPTSRNQDRYTAEEYQKAMAKLDVPRVVSNGAPEIRFATIEDAEAATEALEKILPGSKWLIKQEVFSSLD
jgi:hypothetical protein